MLLKCKQCGYENQIGSIFCRGCGAKVDSSALDPDSPDADIIKRAERKKRLVSTIAGLLKKTFTCLILAFLVITICFLFTTSHAPEYTPANVDTAKLTDQINQRKDLTLSPEEMTALFKEKVMNNITESSGSYVPSEVIFQRDEASGDILKIFIHTKIAGISAVCTLRGRLANGHDSSIRFDPLSVRLGKVNLPFARETVMEKFDPVLKCETMKDLFRDATSVRFTDGKLQIQYGL